MSALAAVLVLCAAGQDYPDEEIYEATVHPDEALVNVVVASSRWPDCTTNRTAIADIFRLEGARSEREKALALWKWFRILVSPTGGGYMYEGSDGEEKLVYDPHKILTVYGHHMCDGQSWSMVALWRAAGYIALDECHGGHTIASLRYRDDDGNYRFHDFDPQKKFYWWDSRHGRVGTWTVPLLRGLVHRHLVAPQNVHTLRTSLRAGERLERRWENEGRVMAAGRPPAVIDLSRDPYYRWRAGRHDGVYAVAGEEVQVYEPEPNPEGIYRVASPYVAIDARFEARLVRASSSDVCRIWLSRDGVRWQKIGEAKGTGEEKLSIDLGRTARAEGRPHVYSAYTFFLKSEVSGASRVEGLRVTGFRELNKRTLPNLMPGENVVRVAADRLAPGRALELEVEYEVNGKAVVERRSISRFPHYFRIDVPGVTARALSDYAQDFNNDALRMIALRMRLIPAGAESPSLPESEAAPAFAAAFPHPADLRAPREVEAYETDLMQTSGFFPQSRAVSTDKERLAGILESYAKGDYQARWIALEEMGDYPEMLDFLCVELEKANIDESMFIVKALAQIGDRRALPALLKRWSRGPASWTPGARYIPDALAVLGDRSVVPALVGRLLSSRFDVRFHIAHALSILGGPEAQAALRDLAQRDPFPAVREFAQEALKKGLGP